MTSELSLTEDGAARIVPRAKVAVYTAIVGGYDDLKPHPDDESVDWICFSDRDQPDLGWQVRKIVPKPNIHPRMVAKRYKVLPHLVLPEYDITIWVDGSHLVRSPHFAREAVEQLGDSSWAQYRHPDRDCIYDELEISLTLQKYVGQSMREQVDNYRTEGHPAHWGLWAAGTLVRRRNQRVADLCREWWSEIICWSYQDQLSLPVVFRRTGIRPVEFHHSQTLGNPWLSIIAHHSEE